MTDLSFAHPGDVVSILNIAEKLEPMMVVTRCEREAGYWCVTCQTALANFGQLEMHAEAGGEHRFVRWCKRHGCPEGPNAADVERLARHQQLEVGAREVQP